MTFESWLKEQAESPKIHRNDKKIKEFKSLVYCYLFECIYFAAEILRDLLLSKSEFAHSLNSSWMKIYFMLVEKEW